MPTDKGYLHPQCVMKPDQTIYNWVDVPQIIQKKILSGTMTEEDWDMDWDLIDD